MWDATVKVQLCQWWQKVAVTLRPHIFSCVTQCVPDRNITLVWGLFFNKILFILPSQALWHHFLPHTHHTSSHLWECVCVVSSQTMALCNRVVDWSSSGIDLNLAYMWRCSDQCQPTRKVHAAVCAFGSSTQGRFLLPSEQTTRQGYSLTSLRHDPPSLKCYSNIVCLS